MKVFLQSIKLYTLLLATLFLGGCSQEDDIEEIFCSGQWSLVNFFETKNWESTNSHGDTPLITKPETSSKNWISITFNDDGSVKGVLTDGEFTARWQGDASTRTISITQVKTTVSPNGTSKEFIERLKQVKYYKGDSRTLQLAPESRTSYIQLMHNND
ncbi:DUF4847 family protein [Phocaeicola barnesiae]|jgi:hypothetical protein|uniref:DUF4847 family protein n=1 Tax=Phocaeicola barnesiae TaxID=376804 RepID=A0AAW5N489_9BACT|nr:DUF4847 family protein [Phocaeicola barnesiae]MBS6467615.1 DUF4847 family protein [Bacteroides sp.]MCF2574917.1 DUF4847 family protein [Phocaeicola barnesiae]MCF2598881.1 DUF4847 family protein [Phocaeicola barnesiae]MCR8872600.1 DUF4847 family protein [Phocaeicola barnesiae]MDM8233358.1 DUF4847 family protein [Phocaeicola barnesiae]